MNRRGRIVSALLAAAMFSGCISFPAYADAGKTDLSQAFFTRLNQSYTYKGKAVYPNFLIACEQVVETDHGDGTATQIIQNMILQRGQDYKASISGNRGIGKATVTAVGKGSYAGTLKASFLIRPSQASVKSVRRGKEKLTVRYRRVPGGCSYQIVWRKKGDHSWKKMSRSGDHAVIPVCRSGKKYEVKVRAYKKTSTGTYYGKWSKNVRARGA